MIQKGRLHIQTLYLRPVSTSASFSSEISSKSSSSIFRIAKNTIHTFGNKNIPSYLIMHRNWKFVKTLFRISPPPPYFSIDHEIEKTTYLPFIALSPVLTLPVSMATSSMIVSSVSVEATFDM